MRNAGLEETQAGIKISGRNINNLRYADDTTLVAESEEGLKSRLMKVKEESEKVGLMLNIQKTKIMASGPTTSWEIDGETVETVSDFIFLGSTITADGDCSHESKRRLLLGRKVMTNLDSIFKSRGINLPTKVRLVSSVQFSRSVVSDSSRPHELQHARPPCPSPTPRVHPDSRPLISWLLSPSVVILEPRKIKSDTVSTVSPSISHEVVGPDAMILVF